MWVSILFFALTAGDPIQLPGQDTYRGLLIGINQYSFVSELKTPTSDIRSLRSVLQSRFAFDQIDLLLDESASTDGILSQLERLVQESHSQENLLIYFAGHGLVRDDGEGYWVPQNGKPNAISSLISYSHLIGVLRRLKSKHVLVIVDACYSGKIFDYQPLIQTGNKVASIYNVPSRWIITSGNETKVSDRGPNRQNSVFAHYFLDFLNTTPEPYLTPMQIVTEVSRNIAANSRAKQYPSCAGLDLQGVATGSFVLWNANAKNPDKGLNFPPPWKANDGETASIELQKLKGHNISIFNGGEKGADLCQRLDRVLMMRTYCLDNQPGRIKREIVSWCPEIDLSTLEELREFLELEHYPIRNHQTDPDARMITCNEEIEIIIFN